MVDPDLWQRIEHAAQDAACAIGVLKHTTPTTPLIDGLYTTMQEICTLVHAYGYQQIPLGRHVTPPPCLA